MNIHKIMHFQLVLQHIKVFFTIHGSSRWQEEESRCSFKVIKGLLIKGLLLLIVMTLGGSFMVCKVDRSSNRFHTGRLT